MATSPTLAEALKTLRAEVARAEEHLASLSSSGAPINDQLQAAGDLFVARQAAREVAPERQRRDTGEEALAALFETERPAPAAPAVSAPEAAQEPADEWAEVDARIAAQRAPKPVPDPAPADDMTPAEAAFLAALQNTPEVTA